MSCLRPSELVQLAVGARSEFLVSSRIAIYCHPDSYSSNLTFGVGGKEKDGKVTKGWGYYEV